MLFGMNADTLIGKSAHVLLFALLAVSLYRATRRYEVTFLLAFIYAGTDEWHQSFVIGRTPRISDIGFDMLGVTLALLLLASFYYLRAYAKRLRNQA